MKNGVKGFTLIELLVTLALLAIVIGVAFSLLLSSNLNYNRIMSLSEEQMAIVFMMDDLDTYIGFGSDVLLLDDNTLTEDGYYTIYANGTGNLVIYDGNVLLTTTSANYTVAGLNIMFSFSSSTAKTIDVVISTNRIAGQVKSIFVQNLPTTFAHSYSRPYPTIKIKK